jgi:hypothetical protein
MKSESTETEMVPLMLRYAAHHGVDELEALWVS